MRVGQAREPEHGLRASSSCARRRLLVGPQLERDGDHLVALLARRASAATALSTPPLSADQHAARAAVEPAWRVLAAARRKRPVQGVGGQVGRVELARRQAAQLAGDRRRAEIRAASSTVAPLGKLDAGAAGRDRRAAALGVEGDALRQPPSSTRSAIANEVAAGGAARAADEGAVGHGPAPARVRQMLLEGMHPEPSLGSPPPDRSPRASAAASYLRREAFETNWLIVW